jgi:serine/threonine protein kinase
VKNLGIGSYSQVWLAENDKKEKCAVKVMDYSSRKFQKAAENEETIEQSIKVRSPYLIKYLQTFVYGKKKFIVMEFCERKDLQALYELCRTNGIPIVEDVCYFRYCYIF